MLTLQYGVILIFLYKVKKIPGAPHPSGVVLITVEHFFQDIVRPHFTFYFIYFLVLLYYKNHFHGILSLNHKTFDVRRNLFEYFVSYFISGGHLEFSQYIDLSQVNLL